MTDVLTLGETMGAFRAAGPFRLGGTAELTVAGAESNVAIGLARLGHAVRWTGVTGADEIGSLVRRTLLAEQVDVGAARITPDAATGLILFEPRTADITRVLYYRGRSAGSLLSTEDVRRSFDAGVPRIVHVTGITPALSESALAAVTEAIHLGHEAGSTVSLDVNFRSKLWSPKAAGKVIQPLLARVDVLIASDDELPIAGDHQVHEVVLKHGADGATARTPDGTWTAAAHRVTVADTTGAGDAFVAGYLSGHLDGLGPEARLRRGNAVAAFAVATPGDWQGLPTRADLELLDLQAGSTVR
ncbi:2-dehydro-3-deoxygluconokinase [Lentzea waywayandensis]|uniref:2-dehydro-3-deoxygluconokinase n=1 Tax=Lentzea waywayandensis TaxID=84724 RepID=A0A1I6ERY1_9PSEU|nr:sugar kinase [Lentzea waywayandensis]SFR20556.1 2-dehydro-3-deoxygluconokinase [Lentzea waywayandensis]